MLHLGSCKTSLSSYNMREILDQWKLATILNSYDISNLDFSHPLPPHPRILHQLYAPVCPSPSWCNNKASQLRPMAPVRWPILDTAQLRTSLSVFSRMDLWSQMPQEEWWIKQSEAGLIPAEPSVCWYTWQPPALHSTECFLKLSDWRTCHVKQRMLFWIALWGKQGAP